MRILLALALALALTLSACAPDAPAPEPLPEEPAATGPRSPDLDGRDVVLITIDTLRADALGFLGNEEVQTPTLDRLAAGGVVFTNAHAHNVVTLPSHANLLTGLYPYQHGVRDNTGFRLPPDVPTLASSLKDAGYTTAACVAAYPLDSRFGLDRGFDLYDDRTGRDTNPGDFHLAERSGDEVVACGKAWWDANADRQRFLWLHLFEPHAPYQPPPPFDRQFADAPYLGEVAAVDAYLAPLLEPWLDAEQAAPLVVLTSDHGEALGEHGEATHGLFAYEATLRVPLVLWAAGAPGAGLPAGLDAHPAGHVDVLPTVLTLLGLTVPPDLPGRSLVAPSDPAVLESRDLYFEALTANLNHGWAPLRGSLRDGSKLIELPLPELYDLASDPGETVNRVDEERRRYHEQRDRLPAESVWPPARETGADAEERARLASLGYMTADAATKDVYTAADDPKTLVHLEQKMQRVVALYRTGEARAAAKLAQDVIDERPSMPMAWSLLAQALLEAGDPRAALDVMAEAQHRGVATASLRRQAALTLVDLGRAEEAVDVLRQLLTVTDSGAIDVASSDPATLTALGIALSASGQQDAAASVLEQSLALDPGSPKTLESLGMVDLRRQRLDTARGYLEEALDLNDALPESWNMLAVARFQSGDGPGALQAWERCLQLRPNNWDVLFNLGLVAPNLGRPDLARQALERFVEGAPERYAADVETARGILAQLP